MEKTYEITLESKYQKGLVIVAQDYEKEWYHNGRRLVKSSYRVLESEREKEEAEKEWDDNAWSPYVCGAWIIIVLGLFAYFLGQA